MGSSKSTKIILGVAVLLIIAGLLYYFKFSPTVKYNKFITAANEKFEQSQLEEAKVLYGDALKVKSDKAYPQYQISTIDSILKFMGIKKAYEDKIRSADMLFEQEKYLEASQFYFEALNINSDDDYPVDQIKLIQDVLKDPSKKPVKKKTNPVVKVEESKANASTPVKVTTTPAKAKTTPVVRTSPEPRPKTTVPASTSTVPDNVVKFADGDYFHIVVGVFSDHNKASRYNKQLLRKGEKSQIIQRPFNMEAVTFGSYDNIHTAYSFLQLVRNDINKKAWVLYYETK